MESIGQSIEDINVIKAALIIEDSKILLIKKNRGAYKGLLDLPGGSLEAEETLDAVIMREVMEETGCNMGAFEQL